MRRNAPTGTGSGDTPVKAAFSCKARAAHRGGVEGAILGSALGGGQQTVGLRDARAPGRGKPRTSREGNSGKAGAARIVFQREIDLRGLISHRFPLAQTAEAIETAAQPSDAVCKVMVHVGEDRDA